MDIRRNDDIRHCTHCKRYGHTAGRCRSRLAAQESRTQQQDARQQQQQRQYQMELGALDEREEAEHAAITTQFEAETARIEADPSCDDTTELLLQELADKETSVTWLRERYAEMRSSVASHYNIPVDTPPDRADPLMDVDAALVPQADPLVVADTPLSPVYDVPQVHPPADIAVTSPSTVDHSSEDDDAEPSYDVDPAVDAAVVPSPPPAVSASQLPAPVTPVAPPPEVFTVKHHFDHTCVDEHIYHLPICTISPHQPSRSAIEEEVLLWLRMQRRGSVLQWDGDTLVLSRRYPISISAFQRPAGEYTWTMRAEVNHFYFAVY